MRTNKLSANPQKTEFMIIGNCKQLKKIDDIPKLELNKAEIKQVQKTKSLGIIVDENLSWKEHFKQVKSKVSNGLAALKNLNTSLHNLNSVKHIVHLSRVICVMQTLYGAAFQNQSYKLYKNFKIELGRSSTQQNKRIHGIITGWT